MQCKECIFNGNRVDTIIEFRAGFRNCGFRYIKSISKIEFFNNLSPWRNRLARLTVNQEVGSSNLPGDDFWLSFILPKSSPKKMIEIPRMATCRCANELYGVQQHGSDSAFRLIAEINLRLSLRASNQD